MISDFGKILDPVADKLTQGVVLICLCFRYPHMGLLVALLVIKETFAAVTGLWSIRRTNQVMGAAWHGKLTTVTLYTVMVVHIVWPPIPLPVFDILVGICMGIMVMSFVLYTVQNMKAIRSSAKKS